MAIEYGQPDATVVSTPPAVMNDAKIPRQPGDFSHLVHHLNSVSRGRKPSPLKDILHFMTVPDMVSLAGGELFYSFTSIMHSKTRSSHYHIGQVSPTPTSSHSAPSRSKRTRAILESSQVHQHHKPFHSPCATHPPPKTSPRFSSIVCAFHLLLIKYLLIVTLVFRLSLGQLLPHLPPSLLHNLLLSTRLF